MRLTGTRRAVEVGFRLGRVNGRGRQAWFAFFLGISVLLHGRCAPFPEVRVPRLPPASRTTITAADSTSRKCFPGSSWGSAWRWPNSRRPLNRRRKTASGSGRYRPAAGTGRPTPDPRFVLLRAYSPMPPRPGSLHPAVMGFDLPVPEVSRRSLAGREMKEKLSLFYLAPERRTGGMAVIPGAAARRFPEFNREALRAVREAETTFFPFPPEIKEKEPCFQLPDRLSLSSGRSPVRKAVYGSWGRYRVHSLETTSTIEPKGVMQSCQGRAQTKRISGYVFAVSRKDG